MTSHAWKKLFEYDTVFSADSVEWCPIEPYLTYFVCGSYFLLEKEEECEEGPQKRIGKLLLMKVTKEELLKVDEVLTFGILDSKWLSRPLNEEIILAAVNAIGEIIICSFANEKLCVKTKYSLKTDEEGDYMTLAVNWSNAELEGANVKLGVTDNKGNAAVLDFSNGELQLIEKWNAHSLEAWTIAFDVNDSNLVYTGGDDAKLRLWDRRMGLASQKSALSRQDTGVTIITTETNIDNVVITGSFDEILLFWDKRNMKVPSSQVQSSGGLWRVKCKNNLALTANIYGGFQIVDTTIKDPIVLGDYKVHSSLAYGADWSKLDCGDVSKMFSVGDCCLLLGTCSFYDHRLTVSLWDCQETL